MPGALFGPAMTTWYAFLNRIKFPSPTKALIYRVWLDQALLTPGALSSFFAPGEVYKFELRADTVDGQWLLHSSSVR